MSMACALWATLMDHLLHVTVSFLLLVDFLLNINDTRLLITKPRFRQSGRLRTFDIQRMVM